MGRLYLRIWVVLCACTFPAHSQTLADLHQQFLNPPDDARIMMRWWWFGPAVENQEIARELRTMKEGGIGGVEVQPVYPVALDDAKGHNNAYLSPAFLDSLKFTAATTKSLGLRMDLTLGSGWPYGGPHISADLASGKLRIEKAKQEAGGRSIVPSLAGGETLIAAFDGDREVALTNIPAGREITFFISSRTGQQVKRPGVGAEGFVLNHYDANAIGLHLRTTADKMFAAMAPNAPYAVFCDSLEVYGADWTPDFLAEFQKRRGYDLRPHLPELFAASEASTALRSDWGRTLTDLLNDNFITPLEAWSKQHATLFRAQAYGTPPASISTAAMVDLPEGEGVQWRTLSQLRYATSAAHLTGRPVISSETWTWLHSPVFRATPLDMKAEANLHFLQGVNQLIGHGWPYTAPGVEYPGWRFYASGVFDESNPWWIAMPDVAKYMQRVSHMLRQGKPANDVALYMPNADAWAHFAPGRVDLRATLAERIGADIVPTILDAGYNFDCFDDGTIDAATRYKMIVLPGVEALPLATLHKLQAYIRGGGIVIATRRLPNRAPGFRATSTENEEVRAATSQWPLATDDKDALAAMLKKSLAPDVTFPANQDLGVLHRTIGPGVEMYFVANTGNESRTFPLTFRQPGASAEVWNPMSTHSKPGADKMVLTLEPYGSRFIIFSKDAAAKASKATGELALTELSNDWRVTFKSAPVEMHTLHSWTDDADTRFYSGTATYEKEISVSDAWVKPGVSVRLDFGEAHAVERTSGMGYQAQLEAPVREAAVVYVNGTRAGAVWCPPYSVDISGMLHSGKNTLRVVAANLALNYMAGHKQPDYKLLNLRYGERFTAQDMDKVQPVTAGLLGPIRMMAVGGN